MLKTPLVALLTAFFCLAPIEISAVGKFAYDRFYESDPDFKKLDGELNARFKSLMSELRGNEKIVLLDEQRKWHKSLFAEMTENLAYNKKPEEAALEVLKARVDDLGKLIDAPRADHILDMPLAFGMSRQTVADKLALKDAASLSARPGNDIPPYKIKLFGEEIPVYFDFSNTKIVGREDNAAAFARFAAGALKREPGDNAVILDSLYAVFTGDLESREDFVILNEELGKKYKRAYPQYPPMAAFLSGKSYAPYDLDDSGVAISSSQYFYEDKERYIIVAGDWGTLTGQFDITYLSKPWAASHIVSEAALIARLTDANSYASGLVILPEDASLAQVLRAIGDRELAWERKAGDYYYFFGEYAGESSDCVLVDLTPANAAFAVTVQYQEGEGLNTFEEDLLKKLEKKYKKLKDTPGEVINFIGYSTSFDTDFETAENYIHFGFAPHFATQHELTIINKKELAKYAKVAAEAEKIDKEKRKERDMEVREESSKF